MMNTYLTDSDEDVIVNFVKDHKAFYDEANEHFKDKARKECLLERFASRHKFSVKVCKDLVWKTHPIQVWPCSQGNDKEAELASA